MAASPTPLATSSGIYDADLSTGSYYVDTAKYSGIIKLNITGNVALHIDGSLTKSGILNVNLAPDATLDVYYAEYQEKTDREIPVFVARRA